MKLLGNIPTIIAVAILAVIGYLVYKLITSIQNCDSFFQFLTTGSCSKAGATGSGGTGFPGAPGSTAPGQCTGGTCDNPKQNACGFTDYIRGNCINLDGGKCGVTDYTFGNCSSGAPPQTAPSGNPGDYSVAPDTTADGYSTADDIFSYSDVNS